MPKNARYRREIPNVSRKRTQKPAVPLHVRRTETSRLPGNRDQAQPILPRIWYEFIVPGDPVGYVRTTQRGKWVDPAFKRYQRYQDAVRNAVLDAYPDDPYIRRMIGLTRRPFVSTFMNQFMVQVKIYFTNRQHPDPDNVVKGVNDALFSSDKYVCGSYEFFYCNEFGLDDAKKPRLMVTVVPRPKSG